MKVHYFKHVHSTNIYIFLGIKTLQQLSGTTAIDSYTQTIIASSKSSISSEISSIIAGLIQLPAGKVFKYTLQLVVCILTFIF